jgi:hypothetical protein
MEALRSLILVDPGWQTIGLGYLAFVQQTIAWILVAREAS